MKVGFTGSASVITDAQLATLRVLLEDARTDGVDWFAHGCCVEADEKAALLARSLGYLLDGYPGRPVGDPYRSRIKNDRLHAVPDSSAPELARNTRIVAVSDLVLAAPSGVKEMRRSGTWATIRRARAAQRPLVIVWPDGTKNMEFAENFGGAISENIPAPPSPGVS